MKNYAGGHQLQNFQYCIKKGYSIYFSKFNFLAFCYIKNKNANKKNYKMQNGWHGTAPARSWCLISSSGMGWNGKWKKF
jgi:hypothetical protein